MTFAHRLPVLRNRVFRPTLYGETNRALDRGAEMLKAEFDPDKASHGAGYPPPHNEKCRGRTTWPLTRKYNLTQFGVNRVEIAAGSWSTQRHWHSVNDEVVIVVSGELVLVTDEGEELLGPGDCVAFKAGVKNAHHLQNRSDQPAVVYDIGGRDLWDVSTFPDAGFQARPRIEINFKPIKE
jgi:uncharacterized cupin superfamily protein